jgi:hypothetical protein
MGRTTSVQALLLLLHPGSAGVACQKLLQLLLAVVGLHYGLWGD